MQHLEIDRCVVTRSHPNCVLTKRPDNHSGNWRCDRVKGTSKCLSGIHSFYMAKGIPCWRCNKHDCDMCIKCMQADKFIEMMTNRED